MRIWLIEDDRDLREAFSLVLQAEGWSVDILENAKQVQRQLRTAQPDVVVLDVFLGGQSSAAVVQLLKATPTLRRIPIILLSGIEDIASVAVTLGADGYIAKPCTIEELLAAIKRLTLPVPG